MYAASIMYHLTNVIELAINVANKIAVTMFSETPLHNTQINISCVSHDLGESNGVEGEIRPTQISHGVHALYSAVPWMLLMKGCSMLPPV